MSGVQLANSALQMPDTSTPQQIPVNLSNFQLVRSSFWRYIIAGYPYLIGVVLVLDVILFGGRFFLTDAPRTSGYICAAVATLFFVRLYNLVPEALQTLWNRGVLMSGEDGQTSEMAYVRFVEEFETRLNNRGGILFGLGVLPVGLTLFYWAFTQFSLETWLGAMLRMILGPLSTFLAGLILWRLIVIAYETSRIPHLFRLLVQPAHPDQSGGLEPLGKLCLNNALVVIGPVLYFVGWVVVLSLPDVLHSYPRIEAQVQVFEIYFKTGLIQVGLLGLLVAELLVFFLPLVEIHQEMKRQQLRHQQHLDKLARRIDRINQELLQLVFGDDSTDPQKSLETLKWLRQVYQENKQFPTWPFNFEIALKLTTSVGVPFLSLTGISKPILEVIGNLLSLVQR